MTFNLPSSPLTARRFDSVKAAFPRCTPSVTVCESVTDVLFALDRFLGSIPKERMNHTDTHTPQARSQGSARDSANRQGSRSGLGSVCLREGKRLAVVVSLL